MRSYNGGERGRYIRQTVLAGKRVHERVFFRTNSRTKQLENFACCVEVETVLQLARRYPVQSVFRNLMLCVQVPRYYLAIGSSFFHVFAEQPRSVGDSTQMRKVDYPRASCSFFLPARPPFPLLGHLSLYSSSTGEACCVQYFRGNLQREKEREGAFARRGEGHSAHDKVCA